MLNLREIEIFNPYTNEAPEELLWQEGMSEDDIERWLSADLVRIAKRGEEALAMYSMDQGDGQTYILRGVVVASNWRKQGLGRWMVGHAIGVAESKGGRHVLFPGTSLSINSLSVNRTRRFLSLIGFVDDAPGLRFDLIPE